MTTDLIITCGCGAIISPDNIDHWNGTNDEGEEYGQVTAYCDVCKKDYETFQWGEWEDESEVITCLKEYIENSNT